VWVRRLAHLSKEQERWDVLGSVAYEEHYEFEVWVRRVAVVFGEMPPVHLSKEQKRWAVLGSIAHEEHCDFEVWVRRVAVVFWEMEQKAFWSALGRLEVLGSVAHEGHYDFEAWVKCVAVAFGETEQKAFALEAPGWGPVPQIPADIVNTLIARLFPVQRCVFHRSSGLLAGFHSQDIHDCRIQSQYPRLGHKD
jgi:hypothetical protein